MTDNLEHTILGSRIQLSNDNLEGALRAIEILKEEIASIESKKPNMGRVDLAVLAALRIANKFDSIDSEYKKSIGDIKSDIESALHYIDSTSDDQLVI